MTSGAYSKTTRLYPINFRRRPNISEDVPNNFEVLEKSMPIYTDLQKSEVSGKVSSSFFQFTLTFRFLHWFELTYFCKLYQLRPHSFQPGVSD